MAAFYMDARITFERTPSSYFHRDEGKVESLKRPLLGGNPRLVSTAATAFLWDGGEGTGDRKFTLTCGFPEETLAAGYPVLSQNLQIHPVFLCH